MESTPPSGQLRIGFITDQRDDAHHLRSNFNVVDIPFARADAQLASLSVDALVVDARDVGRFAEVARFALGGTRPVLVVGPQFMRDDAMRYLDLGAHDVVSSVVHPAELAARLRSIVRRAPQAHPRDDILVCGPLTIALGRREVRRRGEVVRLTPNEFAILELLAREPGALVSHRKLLVGVWGPELVGFRHYLRLYIRQLREKLEDDPANPTLIQTERGQGYRLAVDAPVRAVSA